MGDSNPDDVAAFVRGLDQSALAAVLLELAADHEAVRKRLERLQLSAQPRALAAVFRATLKSWQRSTRFIGYRDSHPFAAELEGWLGEVERELLPKAPELALELIEAFIKSDNKFFERADDSDGCIGDAIRTACTLWLVAASRCEVPRSGWTERLCQLAKADDYGAREQLLKSAHLLLDEPALRALVARFETDLVKALQTSDAAASLPSAVFSASASLHLLADALRDPDVLVRAVLRYSPVPNPLQKAEFARAYLECERPADALKWLEGNWAHHEDSRLRLLAESYAQLKRADECANVRQRLFEATATVEDFRAWRASLSAESRTAADAHARRRAQDHPNPITAASLLLEIGDEPAAESIIVARFEQIDGRDYPRLVALAETLETRRHVLGATACYRALLLAILSKAYARAYSHGARYLSKLRKLALDAPHLQPLEAHESFEATVRSKHGRKTSFWKLINDN